MTIRVSPEVVWEDFKSILVQKFGMEVNVEYLDGDENWVLIKGLDAFNDCCDLIEEQWDDGGDGSMELRVTARRAEGAAQVETRAGHGRLGVGEGRRVNERKANGIADQVLAARRRVVRAVGTGRGARGGGRGAGAKEVMVALAKAVEGMKPSTREALEQLMGDDGVVEVEWEAVRVPPAEFVFRCDCTALRKKTGCKGPVSVRTGGLGQQGAGSGGSGG